MDRQQAEIILKILEIATQDNWRDIADAIEDRGFQPREVVSAWKALEKLAGSTGTAPQLSDFR